MKSFGKWFSEQKPAEPAIIAEPELPEGVTESGGNYFAECRSCGCTYELCYDLSEGFDPDMSYCNGSDRCIP